MADIYKLQYDGMTLAYPGWNGYLQYENIAVPFQRYEITLFKSDNGDGVSAGTVLQPFSAFDEIGIRCSWQDSRALHGCNWLWFPNNVFTASTGNTMLNYMIANDSDYYIFQSNMNWNNANKTFTVLNDQGSKRWGMYSPINTNATIGATNNGSRHKIVGEIVGVKYQ
jgi:hypothetical protein